MCSTASKHIVERKGWFVKVGMHVLAPGRFLGYHAKKKSHDGRWLVKRVDCRLKIPSCDEEDSLELWAALCYYQNLTLAVDRHEYKNQRLLLV